MSSRTAVVTCLSLSTLMPSLDISITAASLPPLAEAFDVTFRDVQAVVVMSLAAITALIAVAGHLGDLVGRKPLMLTGLVVFVAASAMSALAPTLEWLLAARVLQGAGAAVMMALSVGFVGDTIAPERAGRVMGVLGTMSAIGTTCGPALSGFLVAGLGWRAIFLLNVPIGVTTVLLAWRYLPSRRGPVMPWWATVSAVATGRPGLWAGLVMNSLVSTVMMATLVVGPFYLTYALGLATTTVGLALSIGPIVSAVTGVPAGRGVDRIGAQRMVVLGLSAIACGALSIFLLPSGVGLVGYLGPIVVMTAGYAVFQAANNTRVMTGADVRQRGIVGGLLGLSRYLGLMLGATAMGSIFAIGVTSSDVASADPLAVAYGLRLTFGVAVLLAAAAILIAIRRPTLRHSH